jgi:hypothetical protein
MKLSVIMNREKVQEEKNSRIYDPETSIVNPRVKPEHAAGQLHHSHPLSSVA